MSTDEVAVSAAFPSSLGWMAAVWTGPLLGRLTFGHPTRQQAVEALERYPCAPAARGRFEAELIRRLQTFATGSPDDFLDVRLDLSHVSEFARRVVNHCRHIPFGRTLTYAQLAARAGSPRAARAVGNLMAANRVPLIVPCHRVVGAGGSLGGYSAPGSLRTKRRLLEREGGWGQTMIRAYNRRM